MRGVIAYRLKINFMDADRLSKMPFEMYTALIL